MSANTILTTSEVYVPGDKTNVDGAEIGEVHDLRIGTIAFGQLYLTAQNYAIVWPQNRDEFRFKNDNASHFIIKQLDSDKNKLGLRSTGYDTRVILVISRKIRQFHFKSFEKPGDYEQLLGVSGEITFARYDFECNFEGVEAMTRYAFSTDDPEAKSKDSGEMALLIPRTQPLAVGLLQWIANKHIHSRELKRALREPAVYSDVYHRLMKKALTITIL
jgi:hypothetical protein